MRPQSFLVFLVVIYFTILETSSSINIKSFDNDNNIKNIQVDFGDSLQDILNNLKNEPLMWWFEEKKIFLVFCIIQLTE